MLELKDVHTYYGNSHILQGVSFKVPESKCVALLGRNGVGKTTTIHSISGITPPRKGSIKLQGEELAKLPSHKISLAGIALVPQGRRVFPSLTVRENLLMPARSGSDKKEEWNIDKIYELFPALKERETNMGNELSGGQQQMLAIGRALMTNPRFLLMDEPSEGLAPVIIDQIRDIIISLKKTGLPILIVEQNLNLAIEVADSVIVMNKGTIVWEGEPQELMQNKEVLNQYLGV